MRDAFTGRLLARIETGARSRSAHLQATDRKVRYAGKNIPAQFREIAAAGVPRNTARSITEFRDFEALEKELCELPNIGARLVKWTDDDYPPNLREIADPPPYLFVRGPPT